MWGKRLSHYPSKVDMGQVKGLPDGGKITSVMCGGDASHHYVTMCVVEGKDGVKHLVTCGDGKAQMLGRQVGGGRHPNPEVVPISQGLGIISLSCGIGHVAAVVGVDNSVSL